MSTFGYGYSIQSNQSFAGSGSGSASGGIYTVPSGTFAIIGGARISQTGGTFGFIRVTMGSAVYDIASQQALPGIGTGIGYILVPGGSAISFVTNATTWDWAVTLTVFANT